MPTAKQVIDRIEAEGIVPDAVLGSLHADLKASKGLTAEDVTQRLVSFGAITQEQADDLLLASGDSFRMQAKPMSEPKPTAASPFDDEDDQLGDSKPNAAAKRRKKHTKKTSPKGFDSPLILIGGGALALLLLCGVGVVFLLNQKSGDEMIDAADKAYKSRSYSQAITDYEAFVEDFPGHEAWSRAKVQVLISRLRQMVETASNYSGAVKLVQQQIGAVEDEPAFQATAGGELASMLPKVAMQLAQKADSASAEGRSEEAEENAKLATDALTLIANTKYVPKSLRDDSEIATISSLLDRIERRRQALRDLDATLTSMASATSSGDIAAAYQAQAKLIADRPELRDEPRLAEALNAASEAERGKIRLVDQRAEAATDERPSAIAVAVAIANRRQTGTAPAEGVYTAAHGGVLYAVAANDGRFLWRRPVGFATRAVRPVNLNDDLLVIDHRHNELLRVNQTTGALVWRAALEGAATEPTVFETRVFVATESGRLLMLDANTGERLGHLDFAQRLTTPPVVGPNGRLLHQAGEQTSLYSLDLTSLECVGVHYTGHAPGAIAAPPVVAGGRLLVIENVGVETSVLRSFSFDDQGRIGEQNAEFRLNGVATQRPVLSGRRVLVSVDTGEVALFEVNAGPNQTAMIEVARRPTTPETRGAHYLAQISGELWIAEEGLSRSAPSLGDGRLIVREIDDPFSGDRFAGPMKVSKRVLLHARRRRAAPGLTIGATDAKSGAALWQTDVSTQPLGSPWIAKSPQGISVTTSEGGLHRVDRAALRRGYSERPNSSVPGAPKQSFAVTLASGKRLLGSASSKAFLSAGVTGDPTVRSGRLPGVLACRPAAMGEGLLAPLELGQVALVDARGAEIAAPFQPETQLGRKVAWKGPGVGAVDGGQLAVLADDSGNVFCLANEKGALVLRSTYRLAGTETTTRAAIAGKFAAMGVTGNRVAVFGCPDLGAPRTVALPSSIAWGPYAMGERVLLATATGQLIAIDPETGPSIVWNASLSGRAPIGDPLVTSDELVISTDRGVLMRLSPDSGELLGEIDLGQPLGAGPTAYGKRLLVTAADSALLVVNLA